MNSITGGSRPSSRCSDWDFLEDMDIFNPKEAAIEIVANIVTKTNSQPSTPRNSLRGSPVEHLVETEGKGSVSSVSATANKVDAKRSFPKVDQIAKNNPSQLISAFFQHNVPGANIERRQYIEECIRQNADRISADEIIGHLAEKPFTLGANGQSVDYGVKHSLLGAFYMKGDRDYKKLQIALVDKGRRLEMLVFKNRFPAREELEEMAGSLKGSIKVISIEGDYTITGVPEALFSWKQVQELQVSNCPNFKSYSPKEGMPNLTSVVVDGRRCALKPRNGK